MPPQTEAQARQKVLQYMPLESLQHPCMLLIIQQGCLHLMDFDTTLDSLWNSMATAYRAAQAKTEG